MSTRTPPTTQAALQSRYSDAPHTPDIIQENALLRSMAKRGSCREFKDTPISVDVLKALAAIALAAPTKSDLQQRDIVFLTSAGQRNALSNLVSGQAWVANAPALAVFCGNNRRQRLLHDWHEVPFANDHLDAMFNATADAAIALGAFVTAAEALGLGCCPISAVRNRAKDVSKLLGLPQYVFPFAGLAIGQPKDVPEISKRLPLAATCHFDRYGEKGLQTQIEIYNRERTKTQPYATQRFSETFGQSKSYGWSEDKVRQYSQPERANFGAYMRARGFNLD